MMNDVQYLLDRREEEDLIGQMETLAKSYTPEWNFDVNNPDIGSVIALIFAGQMEENIQKYNRVLEKYSTEFVNLLDISLLPAYPASGMVVVDMISDTVDGTMIPKGTKFIGSQNSDEEGIGGISQLSGENTGEQVTFESVHDVYVTSAKLTHAIEISEEKGKIIPIRGEFEQAEVLQKAEPEAEEPIPEKEELSVSLFEFSQNGIQKNGLLIYHETMFEGAGSQIFLKFEMNHKEWLEELIDQEKYSIQYYNEKGDFVPFPKVELRNNTLILETEEKFGKIKNEDFYYGAIYIEAKTRISEEIVIKKILMSTAGSRQEPKFIYENSKEVSKKHFQPFGKTISLYDECYIGNDEIFSQKDSMITVEFHVEFREELVTFSKEEEEISLKPIKKKPKFVLRDRTYTSVCDEIAIEYYNGTGWKKLECTKDERSLFDGTQIGSVYIQFRCPEDWKPLTVGGYTERVFRIQVVRAENCYMVPCIHKAPLITQVDISFHYQNQWLKPDKAERIYATKKQDLTEFLYTEKPFMAFSPLPYEGEALYLGFDHKFEGFPISLLFLLKENGLLTPTPLSFQYSTIKGFEKLKVVDFTDGMVSSGTVLFLPRSDMAKYEIAGQKCYWIRIQREFKDQVIKTFPNIQNILLNGIEVHNVETMEEEAFYIEKEAQNMRVPLNASNILSADVFVNEKSELSYLKMQELLEEHPEKVRAEYDFMGNISNFYVRWEEVENFSNSKKEDRHYMIDRMKNELVFGDGIRVRVPKPSDSAAFLVTVRCCAGAGGNIGRDRISGTSENILYINHIYNPVPTYFGSDMESVQSVHKRAASILNSRNRLISEEDYIREVKAFSDTIDKVSCICGRTIDGGYDDSKVSLVIRMKDYENGHFSFNRMKERLKEHLIEKCETTVQKEDLVITEPLYVRISVDVWIQVPTMENAFEIQGDMQNTIEEYLINSSTSEGWPIGMLPTRNQIQMLLQSVRSGAVIKSFLVTATYYDAEGRHEMDLDAIQDNPFVAVLNGTHSVYVQLSEHERTSR